MIWKDKNHKTKKKKGMEIKIRKVLQILSKRSLLKFFLFFLDSEFQTSFLEFSNDFPSFCHFRAILVISKRVIGSEQNYN